MIAPKNQLLLPYVIFFSILVSHFPLTKDNMDILNHFIDFMTCGMRWRMPPLSVTIELIIYTPKVVFHWNVALIFYVQCFS
jgi:hypothetical protein